MKVSEALYAKKCVCTPRLSIILIFLFYPSQPLFTIPLFSLLHPYYPLSKDIDFARLESLILYNFTLRMSVSMTGYYY